MISKYRSQLDVTEEQYRICQSSIEEDSVKMTELQRQNEALAEELARWKTRKNDMKQPILVHFVKIDMEQNPFNFWQFIAVYAAHLNIKPDILYFHCDVEPTTHWWDKVKPFVRVTQTVAPESTPKGVKINAIANKSDFLKTQLLVQYGGIYLDLDAIPLKSFDNLATTNFPLVVGHNWPGT